MTKPRLRFAPSPTGFLHIGSLRTVLFSYLIAKNLKGEFILRIEDTDEKRKVAGSEKKLIDILDWIGIKFDEGAYIGGKYESYIQSKRNKIYQKYIQKLIDTGEAYYCFCSAERLQKTREDQQKKKIAPRYDRRCRGLSKEEINKKLKAGEKFVIRQKMPINGDIIVKDELRGKIIFKAKELEDHVLIKSNGVPTYQFASVVDDHLMNITHVTRAEEWIPSLPKNILLYKSFNWKPPKFIHYPVVLNKEGGKLSKRQGDVAVEDYRDKGYLPEALINFTALLGWSPYGKNITDNDSKNKNIEILSIDELIKKFDYHKIGTSPAIFDTEKLDYFNGYYIRQINLDKLVKLCLPFLSGLDNKKYSSEYIKQVISLEQERLKKLSDIKDLTKFFFIDKLDYQAELLIWKKMDKIEAKQNIEKIYELLKKIPKENWTNDSIEDCIISYLKINELKVGNYLWPMRVALSGQKASPGPFDIAEVLGMDKTLERIKNGINK